MSIVDFLAGKLGYMSTDRHAADISEYELLLETAAEEKSNLQRMIEALEAQAVSSAAGYAAATEQLEHYVHAAASTGRLHESLERLAKAKGVDVGYLLSDGPKCDPSRIDTDTKLRKVLEMIPEVCIFRHDNRFFAYNLLQRKYAPIPVGKINGTQAAQVFIGLGIESMLVSYKR